MSNFWAKFYEPLPSAPLKPNNASAIFGGHSPYGLRATEPSIFRPKEPTSNKPPKTRRKVGRSSSDVGVSKSSERRKSRELVVPRRKVSEYTRDNENRAKNSRSVSPRLDTVDSEKRPEPDSPDSGESNGDRYPLFISVKKPSESRPRKPSKTSDENISGIPSLHNGCESSIGKPSTSKAKVDIQKTGTPKLNGSPINSLRREKTDFIVRPRKSNSPSDTRSPITALKREKSDITFKRSQSPSGIVRPRGTESPGALRREKSDLALKRIQTPSNFTREKSDLVRPRGSSSPGPLRREKSDITAKRSQSPSGASNFVKPRGSASPGSLRREKSDLTSKRSQSPSGVTREKSDLVKPRGSASPGLLRREKSDVTSKSSQYPRNDIVRPRGSASPGSTRQQKGDIKSAHSSIAKDKSNIVIPRGSESPASSKQEKTAKPLKPSQSESGVESSNTKILEQSQCLQSSEPLVKENTDISKNASGSESAGTVDPKNTKHQNSKSSELLKNEETTTASPRTSPDKSSTQECDLLLKISNSNYITTNSQQLNECRNKSSSNTGEMSKLPTPVSRIPSLTKASTPPSKLPPPKSRIPSFSKPTPKNEEEPKQSQIPTGIPTMTEKPVGKIPGVQRADPAKENKDPAVNQNYEETNKQNINKISRIPSAKSTSSPVSKIPSLNRQESTGEKAQETASSEIYSENVQPQKSRIPSFSSPHQHSGTSTNVSKIPSFSKTSGKPREEPESKIPQVNAVSPKESGIPKPEVTTGGIPKPEIKNSVTTESRIPQLNGPTPKPEVVTSGIPKPESKIPQFSTPPRSKLPAPPGSVLARKDSEERIKKQKIEESLAVEEPTKPTQNPSPTAKIAPPPPPRQDVIKTEEPKVSDNGSPVDDECIFSEAKRMEELLRNESIVVEVPATEDGVPIDVQQAVEVSKLRFEKEPDVKEQVDNMIIAEQSNNNKEIVETKEEKKEQVSFKTFGKREDVVTISSETTTKTEVLNSTKMVLGLKKEETVMKKTTDEEKTDEIKENIPEVTSPIENKEIPAIDTLGQYEQQARRSRSRQRKIISPDAEEPSKTFEQAAVEDENKVQENNELPSKTGDTETKPAAKQTKAKHDKPKFVIESSLGADFYQSKSPQSKDSIADEATAKPKEDMVVIQNKAFDDTKTNVKENEKSEQATNKDSVAFEDVELSSNKDSKMDMRAWSMEQLDEKTVKCSCGRGGKCSIM